jgi:hypothetical protein
MDTLARSSRSCPATLCLPPDVRDPDPDLPADDGRLGADPADGPPARLYDARPPRSGRPPPDLARPRRERDQVHRGLQGARPARRLQVPRRLQAARVSRALRLLLCSTRPLLMPPALPWTFSPQLDVPDELANRLARPLPARRVPALHSRRLPLLREHVQHRRRLWPLCRPLACRRRGREGCRGFGGREENGQGRQAARVRRALGRRKKEGDGAL